MASGTPARKLQVYFPEYQAERHSTQFAFACGLGERAEGDYVFIRDGSMQELRARGQRCFQRVDSCDEADLVSYPHSYAPGSATDEAVNVARRHQLPCVFFRNADRPSPTPLPHGIIFQESIFASRRTPCELPQPAIVDDLLAGQSLTVRTKQRTPVVSFRGFPGTGWHREWLRRLVGGSEAYLGSYLRKKAIRQCQK